MTDLSSVVPKFIDPFLIYLLWVKFCHRRWSLDVDEICNCISDLRFLKRFLLWFERWEKDDYSEEDFENLKSMIHTVGGTWGKLVGVLAETLEEFHLGENSRERTIRIPLLFSSKSGETLEGKEEEEEAFAGLISEGIIDKHRKFHENSKGMFRIGDTLGISEPQTWLPASKIIYEWRKWRPHFETTIEECKLEIKGYCPKLLHCTFNYTSGSTADRILKFLDAILCNLKGVVPLKEQVEAFEKKLSLFQAFFKLVPDYSTMELMNFREGLFKDINKLAWLTFFLWAKAGDEEITDEVKFMVSDMLQKIVKPSELNVASWYFRALKAMRLRQSDDALLLGQAVPGFLDLLFENLRVPLNEDFQILRDRLIILFTFLAYPPENLTEDQELCLIRDQLGDFLPRNRQKRIPRRMRGKRIPPKDLVSTIERLKGKIRKLRHRIPHTFLGASIPHSSSYSFPRTNGLGFIDFLIHNLKQNSNSHKMLIPFSYHLVRKVEQELVSLRPDLDDIFELQKENKQLRDTSLQLINLAYLTEHSVNSCSVILDPIWYNMVLLDDILDKIMIIKGKLDAVKHSNSCNAAVLPKLAGSNGEIPKQAWYSGVNEVMVGSEDEVNTIVDLLTRGPKSREIVSIVGMGGSGKTTLARKVYDTQHVRSCFHIFAFCTVSQVCDPRKLLLNILNDLKVAVGNVDSKTDDDLGHLLHKQLSGKRYIVVMDDIWKIDVWEEVKSSFPDENQGSRVIFTTREGEVARKAKSKVSPHSKHLLSDKESWELLQTKAFPKALCPPNLFDVGQMIARNCRGLPLSVSVIGRLLAEKARSLRVWNEIAEKTTSFASEEGCMKVLELSYNHLPEHLKSCFLYLGVFAEDELISAKRLTLLWIAEGFVQKRQTDSIENVAKEYLTELAERSLVQVAKRSSDNGIEICQVHDIIRDFCQRKAEEENFFQLIIQGVAACNSSPHYNLYRLCVHKEWKSFVDAECPDIGIKSLLYDGRNTNVYGYDSSKFKLPELKLVQILDLEKVHLSGNKNDLYRIIESITSLVHLRYLALTVIGDDYLEVPSSLANLENLETIILKSKSQLNNWWWGEALWKMKRLRHVDVFNCWVSLYQAYPTLENVEFFSRVCITCPTSRALLEKLTNVRELSCIVKSTPLDRDDEKEVAFDVLSKLESLKVNIDTYAHVTFPATLKKLSLFARDLPSGIGKLPCLEILNINCPYETSWDIEDGDFPELKFLELKFAKLKDWNVSDGSFPRLEQLVLVNCLELQELPAVFSESTTLKTIEVHKSSSSLASSAREIQDEQKDLGNEIQLIISDTKE